MTCAATCCAGHTFVSAALSGYVLHMIVIEISFHEYTAIQMIQKRYILML